MDGKDLIYEGIATSPRPCNRPEIVLPFDGKDLIYEGIATAVLRSDFTKPPLTEKT